jgi:DNA-binding IclR family transcriptional regulator
MEYGVPSVALAAQALKLLSRHKYRSSSLKVIATRLDASPTTCLRILRSLEREDFVRYDRETRKYSLGPYLIPLGNRAAELNDAFARASAEIKRVAAQTGLITALVQRWDDLPVFIASAEPPADDNRFTRLSISIGEAIPLTAGAHGRCFTLPPGCVPSRRPPSPTPRSSSRRCAECDARDTPSPMANFTVARPPWTRPSSGRPGRSSW